MSYDDLMGDSEHAAPEQSSVSASAPRRGTASRPAPGWAGLDQRVPPPRSMSAVIVERLSRDIHAGTLRPGDRLPTEQQLGAAMGVSRTVVREAVAALRSDGLVVARQGSGTFVAALADRRAFRVDPAALSSITDMLLLMELRTGVESEAAGLAAERRTPDDLRAIDAALDAYDAARRTGSPMGSDDPAHADQAFHRAVLHAARNTYFAEFGRYLSQLIAPGQGVRAMAVPPAGRAAYLRRVQAEHRAIRDAVAAGNADAARDAAGRHLRNSRSRFGRLRDRLSKG